MEGGGGNVQDRSLRRPEDRDRAGEFAARHGERAVGQVYCVSLNQLVGDTAGPRCARKVHGDEPHRAALLCKGAAGGTKDLPVALCTVGVDQAAVLNGQVCRAADLEQRAGGACLQRKAAEVERELSGIQRKQDVGAAAVVVADVVDVVAVKRHVAQQAQGRIVGSSRRSPRIGEGFIICHSSVRRGQRGHVDLPLADILTLAVRADGLVMAGHTALLTLGLALNVHDEPMLVRGDIIRLIQCCFALDIFRHIPICVEEGAAFRQQLFDETAVLPFDLVELSAGQLGIRGLVDGQNADLDAVSVGRILDHQRAVDLLIAEDDNADLAVALEGQRSVLHDKADLAYGMAVQVDRAVALRYEGAARDVTQQNDRIAVCKVAFPQFFDIAHRAVLAGDLAFVQLAAVIAVALGFVHGAVIAFHDLKLGKARCGREHPAVGHQSVGIAEYALVVPEGIARLQQVGDGHIAGAVKADGAEIAAGELHIFQALGVGGGQDQFSNIAAADGHGRLGAGEAEGLHTVAVILHRYGAARRLHGDPIELTVCHGEGGLIPAHDDLAGAEHDVVVQVKPDVVCAHIQIRVPQIIPRAKQRNGDLILPVGLEGIPCLDEGSIVHRA